MIDHPEIAEWEAREPSPPDAFTVDELDEPAPTTLKGEDE